MINFFKEKSLIRDHFELDEEFKSDRLRFPCCVCTHRHGTERDEPCNRCRHNDIAGKYET